MEPVGHPRVKVCCIGSAHEARAAVRAGAAALGFVSRMPSGPGVIDEELIGEIVRGVPPGVGTFLLTSSQSADEIVAQQRRCRVNTVQICDRLIAGSYADLRAAMPGVSIVQVVHVVGEESVAEAKAVASEVDAILLDSGKPSLAVKELGGTGRRHDWKISRRIRESVAVPVFLAGGLRAENAAEAIEIVRPFALDICSGVRTDGKLDEAKLESFMDAVGSAISA
jgi:phosphoribosylanthranilate isomerase